MLSTNRDHVYRRAIWPLACAALLVLSGCSSSDLSSGDGAGDATSDDSIARPLDARIDEGHPVSDGSSTAFDAPRDAGADDHGFDAGTSSELTLSDGNGAPDVNGDDTSVGSDAVTGTGEASSADAHDAGGDTSSSPDATQEAGEAGAADDAGTLTDTGTPNDSTLREGGADGGTADAGTLTDTGTPNDSTLSETDTASGADAPDASMSGDSTAGAPDASASDAPPAAEGGGTALCPNADWCWCSPRPTGNPLRAVWSSSSTDAWAVGGLGTVLHYDGGSWTLRSAGVSVNLTGVWGATASDVWIVGDAGTIVHWDGASWSPAASGTTLPLRGVWGRAANDVWALGGTDSQTPRGVILHWDGTQWTLAATPNMVAYSAWASAPTDVYVAGTTITDSSGQPVLVHWDGANWSMVNLSAPSSGTPPTQPGYGLTSVWGSGPGDIWATGPGGGYAYHFASGSWNYTQGRPDAVSGAATIIGTSASDAWSSNGYHWNGASWISTGPTGVFAFPRTSSDVWNVGNGGAISHYDGSTWSQSAPSTITRDRLDAVWASASNDVYLISAGAASYQHWNGTSWSALPNPLHGLQTPFYLQGASEERARIWGSSSTDIWRVATVSTPTTAIYVLGTHWDGNAWSAPVSISSNEDVWDIAGTGPNDVWVATAPRSSGGSGSGTYHWDGNSWTSITTGLAHGSTVVWPSAVDDVWVFAFSGTVHWDGNAWSPVPSVATAEDAWGSARNDVWVIANGNVQHWDGNAWSASTPLPTSQLPATGGASLLHGSASNDVWAQLGGAFFHWRGSSWTAEPLTTASLVDMFAVPGGSAWAIGSSASNAVVLCR